MEMDGVVSSRILIRRVIPVSCFVVANKFNTRFELKDKRYLVRAWVIQQKWWEVWVPIHS